jgi:cytochrome c-type biogenesis protein
MMEPSGGISDYFIAFVSGVLVSFTPCVYPVMPMTASFIAGANTTGTRWHGFAISLIYVLGMALVYAGLAVFAALSGKLFGQIQQSPLFLFGVAFGLVFFAFVMFDKIEIPTIGHHKHHKLKPDSLWSVFLFGTISGFIVGPCTAPVLGSLLLYVASKQNILLGTTLMFVFAYGVGFSLILVGTFSGVLSRLPKSGFWLLRIKQLAGVILLGMGLFFMYKGFNNLN